jgi:hypothetical protein
MCDGIGCMRTCTTLAAGPLYRCRCHAPRRLDTGCDRLARAVFERGVRRGEFLPGVDADVALDALWAPIYYRMLVSGAPLDAAFVDAHAAIVLRGLQP